MAQADAKFWARARRARDKLASQFLDHPDVSLIDIGHPMAHGRISEEIVLRIHVKERWWKARPEERAIFPQQVDDIPVVVMRGDYQLESDASTAGEE